jgi:hypothetical protein
LEEETMRTLIRSVAPVVLVVSVFLMTANDGWAQEKRRIAWSTSAATTKYTEQHALDVADIPGHQLRIYQLHRTYSNEPPVFEDVKVVEDWTQGVSDYINVNGHTGGYGHYVFENGDKIFYRWDGTSHTVVSGDGSRKSNFVGTTVFTGGTGKFHGVSGMLQAVFRFDPKAGINEGRVEGEYWIAK